MDTEGENENMENFNTEAEVNNLGFAENRRRLSGLQTIVGNLQDDLLGADAIISETSTAAGTSNLVLTTSAPSNSNFFEGQTAPLHSFNHQGLDQRDKNLEASPHIFLPENLDNISSSEVILDFKKLSNQFKIQQQQQQLQAAKIEQLHAELKTRQEINMDLIQYQHVLKIQNDSVAALRENKDKIILDSMKTRYNKRFMMYNLKEDHLIQDLNLIWKEVNPPDFVGNNIVSVNNLIKVNEAIKKQMDLLEEFSLWNKQERVFIEAANSSSEGWLTAEAMQKGTGIFSVNDEANTKIKREAEALVKREKKEKEKDKLARNNHNKSKSNYSNKYRQNVKYQYYYKNRDRSPYRRSPSRSYHYSDKSRNVKIEAATAVKKATGDAGPVCYICLAPGHISKYCTKK